MKNIGELLKQSRIEQNFSLEDAVIKTKFTIAQIRAIEAGDLDYFIDDLSYFSYFIRHYANSLNFDYELIREEVDFIVDSVGYTQEVEQIKKINDIKENIQKSKPKKSKTLKKKKNVDYSFVAFLASSILLVVILAYVGIKYVPGWFKAEPIKPPVVDVKPGETPDTETPSTETPGEIPGEEEPAETDILKIKQVDPTHYDITDWVDDSDVEIKLVFKANQTWISATVNGAKLSEPKSTTYYKDDEIVVSEKITENKEIMFHMGIMGGNEFYINGVKVELDETIQNSSGVAKIYFKFVKDGIEN